MPKRKIAVLLANGKWARLLIPSHDSGDFQNVLTIEDGPAATLGPGRAGHDERVRRRMIDAFIGVVVSQVAHFLQRHPMDGLVVAAPGRVLGDLAKAADPVCPVLARRQKDLIRRAEHDIAHLLSDELLAAERALPQA